MLISLRAPQHRGCEAVVCGVGPSCPVPAAAPTARLHAPPEADTVQPCCEMRRRGNYSAGFGFGFTKAAGGCRTASGGRGNSSSFTVGTATECHNKCARDSSCLAYGTAPRNGTDTIQCEIHTAAITSSSGGQCPRGWVGLGFSKGMILVRSPRPAYCYASRNPARLLLFPGQPDYWCRCGRQGRQGCARA